MNYYLVYATLTPWEEPPRSRHQITACLQEKGKVYFVERNRIGYPRLELSKPEDNLIMVTPYFPIDYRVRYRIPGLSEFYHFWLLRQIKGLNVDFEIVFTFDHTSHIIHHFYNNVVYYCGDEFIGNADISLSIINLFHKNIEQKLTAKSKMCVVTSDYLWAKQKKFNTNTHLIPLGSPNISHKRKYRLPVNKVPTLGLVGFLNRKIPLDVLDLLLLEYKIYLIGPVEQHIKARYRHNINAVFTGPKSGMELYKLLDEEVDVCIAPYAEDKINKGVTPNKLWLYLALGKPCVVTEIPNIKDWNFEAKLIYKCSNHDFSRTCRGAFEENNELLFAKRMQIAKENAWEERIKRILGQYYNIQVSKAADVLQIR